MCADLPLGVRVGELPKLETEKKKTSPGRLSMPSSGGRARVFKMQTPVSWPSWRWEMERAGLGMESWRKQSRAFLVVQWLRFCLAMQGTPVGSLVWEDLTCCGAATSMHHNYEACALKPMSRTCSQRSRHKKPAHRSRAAPTHCN
ncbi:uncharacterized protein ACBT57_023907 [Dama dama]